MHNYYVISNKQLTPTTLLLTLKQEPGSRLFSFQPGQYAALSFKHHGRPTPTRCFSIVSSPTEQDILQFSTRIGGRFTRAMTDLKEGDKVKVRGPYGGFVYDGATDTDTVLLAGGIGITPFMSMISYASVASPGNILTLVFSCQSQDDVPFGEQIKAFERQNPNFKAVFIIGKGPTDKFAGFRGAVGRVTPEIMDQVANGSYASKSFFICGPPPFMKGMTSILMDKGGPTTRVVTEAFSQGSKRSTGKIRSWPMNVYVLSAAGVGLGIAAVMTTDLLKTLPPSSILNSSSLVRSSRLTNSRQADLDDLVNKLPDDAGTARDTDGVTKALQAAIAARPAATVAPVAGIKSGQPAAAVAKTLAPKAPGAVAPSSVTPPPPAPVVTPPPPPPPPVPKCTTTQSGKTICV